MKIFSTILFSILCGWVYSQTVIKGSLPDGTKYEYEVVEGKIWGKYISRYPNGAIKSKGELYQNVRSGIWTVYDSTGRKVHERNYNTDHLSYVKLFPEKETKGPASLFDTCLYHAYLKNDNGLIPLFDLKERMVLYSSRYWREIKPLENKNLFTKDFLYKSIYTILIDSTKNNYCSKDDGFKAQLKISDLKKYSLKEYKIISWKIKEDVIYDIERNVSETRIIGICPVGIHKKNKDTTDLYWIYYPYARQHLTQTSPSLGGGEGRFWSIDDLFFNRGFSSEIYKVGAASDKTLEELFPKAVDLKNAQQMAEVLILETEHDIWLGNLPD